MNCLQKHSGLGDWIGFDFEAMDLNRMYRASDMLCNHRDASQVHLFAQDQVLFGFAPTITLYDLTNIYFEGIAAGVAKAKRGHSKVSRCECPLVRLAVALDADDHAMSEFIEKLYLRVRKYNGSAITATQDVAHYHATS